MQLLAKMFKLDRLNTDVKTEVIAGLATFMTMAYVLIVQPSAIVGFGEASYLIDVAGVKITKEAIMVTCALSSAVTTLLMALYTNLPFALSTAMGFNFMFGIMIQSKALAFGEVMSIILITGILLVVLSLTGLRGLIVKILPRNLKISIAAAIGFFISYIGFKTSGIGVFKDGGIMMGDVMSINVILALLGILIISTLTAHKVKGAIFIGIIVITIIGIPLGVTKIPDGSLIKVFDTHDLGNLMFNLELGNLLTLKGIILIFIVVVGEFFNTLGTLLGISSKANMLDKEGNLPDIQKPFLVDSIGTCLGAASGNTVVTTYVESAAGIEAGGRSGLTGVVVSICFFLMLFLSPIVLMIPAAATAPALIFVGFLMIKTFQEVDLSDFTEAIGPLVTIIFTIFTASIPGGISAGILTYIMMKVITGRWRDVHPVLYLMAVPMVLYFIFQ